MKNTFETMQHYYYKSELKALGLKPSQIRELGSPDLESTNSYGRPAYLYLRTRVEKLLPRPDEQTVKDEFTVQIGIWNGAAYEIMENHDFDCLDAAIQFAKNCGNGDWSEGTKVEVTVQRSRHGPDDYYPVLKTFHFVKTGGDR